MYKLLIVDDEPLVRIALNSILDWASYNIEICANATNGAQALEIIEEKRPDIIICDIKMPIMSGLELAKECSERYGRPPLFIMLTSYGEFSLAQEAIRYQVVDYLLKLELTKDTLAPTIMKALDILKQIAPSEPSESAGKELTPYKDKLFLKLIHNLFEDENELFSQADSLGIDLNYPTFTACYCEVLHNDAKNKSSEQLITLYQSSLKMFEELISKYLKAYLVTPDMEHFCLICCFDEYISSDDICHILENALGKTSTMIHNYFGSTLLFSVGTECHSPMLMHESYRQAKNAFSLAAESNPIIFAATAEILQKEYKNRTITSVQNYIKEHITERLSLSDIAEQYGLSPNYLSALFKKYTDVGFSEYIQRARIEKAKELMQDSTLKVYEISDMLNFDNAFYFSKVFKKHTGMSPKEYLQHAE